MRKILIINRLGIGDIVLTTPLAQMIKEKINAKIGFVVAEKSVDLLINHQFIDDVFGYNKKNKQQLVDKIKKCGYNEAILVDERLTSTLLALKLNCKLLNYGLEFTIGKNKIFPRKYNSKKAINDFASYIRYIDRKNEISIPLPTLGRVEEERLKNIDLRIQEIKKITRKIVLISPKSAAMHKNWDVEELGKLNLFLNKHKIYPVYIGGKFDKTYIDEIKGEKINVAGQFSLREILVIAKEAVFAISVCTGPLHVLSCTNIPIIAIYGPSDPERWAPRNAIVVQSKLDCVPCLNWSECIRNDNQTCMKEITYERIVNIIEKNAWL